MSLPVILAAAAFRAPSSHLRTRLVAASMSGVGVGVGVKTAAGMDAPDLPSPDFTSDFTASSARKADWAAAYANHLEEESYEITDIEGAIPNDLHGTLFRNGPGRIERSGQMYSHIFDGDGMVHAFAIHDGRCCVRNSFVKTAEWEEEEAAGKLIHRNTFGTQPIGGWRANMGNVMQKNVANTNILYFGGKLLALWEAAQPYRLDPATLRTIALETLDGFLQPGMPFSACRPHSTPSRPCVPPPY